MTFLYIFLDKLLFTWLAKLSRGKLSLLAYFFFFCTSNFFFPDIFSYRSIYNLNLASASNFCPFSSYIFFFTSIDLFGVALFHFFHLEYIHKPLKLSQLKTTLDHYLLHLINLTFYLYSSIFVKLLEFLTSICF